MGCFLGCFGGSKEDKRRKIAQNYPSRYPEYGNQQQHQYLPVLQQTSQEKVNVADKPKIPVTIVKHEEEGEEEQLSLPNAIQSKAEEELSPATPTRKKVTFDSNVREYEHVLAAEVATEIALEREKGIEEIAEKTAKSSSSSGSGSTLSSVGSYPPNHRYQNCRESDDEDDVLDDEVSDVDEDVDVDEDGHGKNDEEEDFNYEDLDVVYETSYEQELSPAGICPSMESKTNCSATHVVNDDATSHEVTPEIESKTPAGYIRGARDRGGYVHSVLNPVENMTQWKEVKGRGNQGLKQQKENAPVDLSSKRCPPKAKLNFDEPKTEVAVDASLSTWLSSSQKTPPVKAAVVGLEPISSGASASSYGSNSVRIHEERPILGALTVEELKQFSASTSPRRSPSRSPDDKPLVGTVGMHWNSKTPTEDSRSASSFKGIPNTTSKYREDNSVKWHSTPFETRLERALNRGAAETDAKDRAC